MNGDDILELIGTPGNMKSNYYGYISHLGIVAYHSLNCPGASRGFATSFFKAYSLGSQAGMGLNFLPNFLARIPYYQDIYYKYGLPVVREYSQSGLVQSIVNDLCDRDSKLSKLTKELLGGVEVCRLFRNREEFDDHPTIPYLSVDLPFSDSGEEVTIKNATYKVNNFNFTRTALSWERYCNPPVLIFKAPDNRLGTRLHESPLFDYVRKYRIINNY